MDLLRTGPQDVECISMEILQTNAILDPCKNNSHRLEKGIVGIAFQLAASASMGSGIQSDLAWHKDVSHARIPDRLASGRLGSKQFVVSRAQLRESVNPGKSRKDVTYNTLELTAKDGTPGAEFILGVTAGTTVDGQTLWYRDIFSHSPSIVVGEGMRRVEYVPIQSIWLHGARKPEFKLLSVFEMRGVMHYSIRVEFGKRSHGKITGKIYFCGEADNFMKAPESVIVGSFNATITSPRTLTPATLTHSSGSRG